jgi:MoaA/NifB/PqqE/SkfB family radical SAM enzyme
MSDWDPVNLAKTSKTFCIFPWIHQYVGPRGDVKPCCVYDHDAELGSLKKNSLDEIWNNVETKEMRLQFLRGEQHSKCGICNNRSDIGDSFYNLYNQIFFENNTDVQQIVANTNPDGSVGNHKLFYIDVRFNNLCNLKCRSCAPHFSTSWVSDHRKLYNRKELSAVDDGYQFPGKTETQALDEIIPHLSDAEMIYFAGGEPLMQKEHYDVLDKLIEVGNLDLEIRYNTNFTNLKLKNYNDAIYYWKHFKNVNVHASLDGNHKKAEYWRSGTDWDLIVKNRECLLSECPHVNFKISFTLSWVNAHNLVEFHREWVEKGYITPDHIMINPLDTPHYYCLKNIPEWKKKEIEDLFLDQIEWLSQFSTCDSTINRYQTAINFMRSDVGVHDLTESLKFFNRITKKLDSIREEDFFSVFPEHNNIRQYLIENGLNVEFIY